MLSDGFTGLRAPPSLRRMISIPVPRGSSADPRSCCSLACCTCVKSAGAGKDGIPGKSWDEFDEGWGTSGFNGPGSWMR